MLLCFLEIGSKDKHNYDLFRHTEILFSLFFLIYDFSIKLIKTHKKSILHEYVLSMGLREGTNIALNPLNRDTCDYSATYYNVVSSVYRKLTLYR